MTLQEYIKNNNIEIITPEIIKNFCIKCEEINKAR